ncbi:MAG: HAMP domain-containing histidine kinase [Elusimicrobia bacterium]|nr:HAMP domain-containing histidine kinase [Elusimicrobiota bacterium]
MTIQLKLALALAGGMTAATLASGGVFLQLQRGAFRGAEREKLERVVRDVARIGAEAQGSADTLLLLDYLSSLRRELPELSSCRLRIGDRWQSVGTEPPAGEPPPLLRLVELPARGRAPPLSVELGFSESRLREPQSRTLRTMAWNLGWSIGLVLLLGVAASAALGWRLTHRIVDVERQIGEIGQGRWTERPVRGSDEIARLARGVNAMSAQLRELEQAKKAFVASVTHELRSPLAAIEAQVRGLLAAPAPRAGEEREKLDRILRSANRLGHFVTSLLEMAKIERGKMDFYPKASDLGALVEDSVAFFADRAREARLELALEAKPSLPPIELDPDLVAQVLSNLISNALKFTPAGGRVRVGVSWLSENGSPGARCWVEDTGVGLAPEDARRIFQPFERVPNPLKATGAGLGLAISRAIVEAHGGSLGVDSTPGKGSRFHFFLPERVPKRPDAVTKKA